MRTCFLWELVCISSLGGEAVRHDEIVVDKRYPGLNPMTFGYQDCTPRYSYGPAVRDYWLLHYVVSGTGIFRREGNTWQVKAGEIFVIPPCMETYYEADGSDPWQYIWVGFQADMELPEVLHQPVIRCRGADRIFAAMRSCHGMKNGKSAFLSGRLWELMCAVMEEGKTDTDYIEKALSIMRAEYDRPINASQIAQRVGLDRSYFTTLFKIQVGQTPGKYLADLRLEKARELMTVHGEPPAVVAASVGYSDLCVFSKAFKRKYGVSPRQYRRDR